jgi:hypothetical protein
MSSWQRMYWWERDPTLPDPKLEEPDEDEEYHVAPNPDIVEGVPHLIPIDIEDSSSSSSTSSNKFPKERPPRQLSAHPSLRMSTRDTKLWAGAPITFNGNIKKATHWLYSVKAYFAVNAIIYNTNEKKVVITLAYMMEGTAGSWSSTFYQTCEGRTLKYGTFAKFKTTFKEMVIPINVSIVALNKINELEQKGDLTSYVAEFYSLVAIANVKESHILTHLFNLGLQPSLVQAIHMMESIPNDFDKYITTVMKINSNINQGNTTITLTAAKNYHHYCLNPKPQCKDDDAMDIDCLNEEAHAEHMSKGLCFNCHEHSHRAARCPKKDKKKKVPVRQEKIKEEEDDEVETHHLAEDF